jgi:hypothetical protein
MGDPFDGIGEWLDTPVEPLPPPPGTFRRIRRRARRRKAGKLLTSAAGAVIVIAAAVTVPVVASSLHGKPSPAGQQAAGSRGSSSPAPVASRGSGGSSNSQSGSKVSTRPARLSKTGNGSGVPDNFQPISVTFISQTIGAVIGQAGTPGHCQTADCTSLAGTADYGVTWYGVNAPVTGPPDGPAGVSQLRFLDINDGWAFGPALWVTHDGGGHWAQEQMPGLRVTSLETAGNRAFGLFGTCTGSGSAYGAHCTSFSLYSSAEGSDQWTLVPGPSSGLAALAGQAGSASLVLAAGRGYLLAPSGELLSGPLTGAAWTVASPAVPCKPAAPGAGGQPTAAFLAADSAQLVLVCASPAPGDGSQLKSVFQSADGGATWSAAGPAPATGTVASFAAQPGGMLVLATDSGIYRSVNGGATWRLAAASPAGAPAGQAGFSYVGMTSMSNGVALPADPDLHEVFTTSDGGNTWQPRQVGRP